MRNGEQAPTLMFLLSGMVSGIYSPNADTQELQLFSTLWPALRLFTPPFAFLYCLAHVDEKTQRNGEAFWGHGAAAPSRNLGTCQWVCWRFLPKIVGSSFLGAPLAWWPRGRGLPGSPCCPAHPSHWPQPLMEGIRARIWLGIAPGCSPRGRGEANVKLCPRKDIKGLTCGSTTSLGDG